MTRLTLLSLFLIWFPGCANPVPTPITLRIMSYNIHHGEGTDGVFDLERLARIISGQNPDLVALQEVDRETSRSGGIDQAAELARLTNMHHAYGAAMDYAGGKYGEAILSRWPIIDVENFVVENREGSEPRAMIIVRVNPPESSGNPEIAFAGTHLAHDSSNDRVEQAWRMSMKLDEPPYDAMALILAGDLNALPGSEPMRELLETGGWQDAFEANPLPTYPNVDPDRRIDWILIKPPPGVRCDILETLVIKNENSSDHCAILAEIRLWYDERR